jgi:hypothetical protein
MEDTPNPAAEKWIHKRLWLRWFRILYGVLFLWAAGLGFARGSWRWALWPFLAFAAFLIFRSWLQRIEPRIARPLAFTLALALLTHNVVGTLWPSFVGHFPHIAQGIARLQGRTDVTVGINLGCDATLQQSLADYALASQDAEAKNLKREFDVLTAARQGGIFGAVDEQHEKDLLQRYRRLIQRSAELRRTISESGCTVQAATPAGEPALIPQDNRDGAKQGTGVKSNPPNITSDKQRDRLDQFRLLVNSRNSSPSSNSRNIAILINGPVVTGNLSPVEAFYGQLRSGDVHFITDLFRHDVFSRGYFDDMYQGNQEMLRIAINSMHVDGLVLGRISYTFRKDTTVDSQLISCDMGLSYKVFNRSGDIAQDDSFQVIGPGFSESAALERAVQILANQFSGRMPSTL